MPIAKKVYWKITNKYYNLQKNIHELKYLGIEITNRCNLNCFHCYMNSSNTEIDILDTQDWKSFFVNLKNDFGSNIVIQITGGEPLIRDDIFEILEYIKKLGFRITLVSNGTLLNEDKLKKLSKYLSSLSISLDGFNENHDKLRNSNIYEIVLNNIKLAIELKINFLIIKTTVHRNNIKDLGNFYDFINKLGVNQWHLFAMEPIGRGTNNDQILLIEEYKELCGFIDKIKKDKSKKIKIKFEEEGSDFMYEKTCEQCKFKLCNAGISSCAILYNGDIVNCIQDNRNNIQIQGNILKNNFKKIWNSEFMANRCEDYKFCNNHYYLNKLSNL